MAYNLQVDNRDPKATPGQLLDGDRWLTLEAFLKQEVTSRSKMHQVDRLLTQPVSLPSVPYSSSVPSVPSIGIKDEKRLGLEVLGPCGSQT